MENNLNATELRIGNYVLHKIYGISRIQIIGDASNQEYIGGRSLEGNYFSNSHLPIPLTEEWLDRLGFYSKYKSNHKMWNIFGFNLHQIPDEDENGNKIPQEQIFYYEFSYEIKYVHQLQNLYFALTGKELTIKEQ